VIRERGGLIYYIHRQEAEDALARAKAEGNKLATNVSEAYHERLREEADRVIINDGTLDDLHDIILKAVREDLGEFEFWSAPLDPIHKLRTGL